MSGAIPPPPELINISGPEAAKPAEVCKVCGDRASGKHYGVVSCDGCRGFFKRSIRKKQEQVYLCKDNNTCIVDVNRRNQCQACRFRKCMAMKMNPNAVQKERSPRPPREQASGGFDLASGTSAARLFPGSSSFLFPHAVMGSYPGLAFAPHFYYSHHPLAPAPSPPGYGSLATQLAASAHLNLSATSRKQRAEDLFRHEAKKIKTESRTVDDLQDVLHVMTTAERGRSRGAMTSAHATSPDSGNVTGSSYLSVSSDQSPPTDHDPSPPREAYSSSSSRSFLLGQSPELRIRNKLGQSPDRHTKDDSSLGQSVDLHTMNKPLGQSPNRYTKDKSLGQSLGHRTKDKSPGQSPDPHTKDKSPGQSPDLHTKDKSPGQCPDLHTKDKSLCQSPGLYTKDDISAGQASDLHAKDVSLAQSPDAVAKSPVCVDQVAIASRPSLVSNGTSAGDSQDLPTASLTGPSPQSASRSPQSASRSPHPISRSPQSASQCPQSASQCPQSASQCPQSASQCPQSASQCAELGVKTSFSPCLCTTPRHVSGTADLCPTRQDRPSTAVDRPSTAVDRPFTAVDRPSSAEQRASKSSAFAATPSADGLTSNSVAGYLSISPNAGSLASQFTTKYLPISPTTSMPHSSRFSFPFQSSSLLYAPPPSPQFAGVLYAPPPSLLSSPLSAARPLSGHGALPLPLSHPSPDTALLPSAHRLATLDSAFTPFPSAHASNVSAFLDAAASSYLSNYVAPTGRGLALNPALPLSGSFPWSGPLSGSARAQGAEDAAWRELYQVALHVLHEDLRWLSTVPAFLSLPSSDRQRLVERGGCAMMLWGFHFRHRLSDLIHYLTRWSNAAGTSKAVTYLCFCERLGGLDFQEYTCLRLLSLFPADVGGVSDTASAASIGSAVSTSLRTYLETKRDLVESPNMRHTNLLTYCNNMLQVDHSVLAATLFKQNPGEDNFICRLATSFV